MSPEFRLILAVIAIASANCRPTSVATLTERLNDAETAFAEMDEDGFHRADEDIRRDLPCVDAIVPGAFAAAWHRHMALAAFLSGDSAGTLQSLQAAARLAGANAISDTLAPRGTELRALADQARAHPPTATRGLPAPGWVDGAQASKRPSTVPILLQYTGEGGKLQWTGYLNPDDEPPALAVSSSTTPATPTSRRWDARRGPGIYGGVDVGLPLAGRIDYKFGGDTISSVGMRAGVNYGVAFSSGPHAVLFLAASGDYGIGANWDLEFTAGIAGNTSYYGYILGGALQYDPASTFQLNLGTMLGYYSGGIALYPDITAGFMF